jgi:hypothetical protein
MMLTGDRQMPLGRPRSTAIVAALLVGLAAGAASLPSPAGAQTPAPPGSLVYFHYPLDQSYVSQRFTVRIGLKEMGVAPAGIDKAGTGHHHLLIDVDSIDMAAPIPSDYNHIHLGNGQTEVLLTLAPGTHTLQLLVGDHAHTPHKPPVVSKKITVYVR